MSWLTNLRDQSASLLAAVFPPVASATPPLINPFATQASTLDSSDTSSSPQAISYDSVYGPSLTGGQAAARLGDLSSGLGIPGRDPFYSQFWSASTLTSTSVTEIDALSRDGLVYKILGAPWSDALRAWFDIRGMSPKLQDLVQFHLRRLNAKQELWHLNFLRDQWGSSILILGANDLPSGLTPSQELNHFSSPLNLEQLAHNKEILWLRAFGKESAWGYESGFTPQKQAGAWSPLFGHPTLFEIHDFWAPAKPGYTDLSRPDAGPLIVHYSRTLHATTPDARSKLIQLDPYLKAYQGALASAGQLLRTSSVSFIKVAHWLQKTRNNRAESHARLSFAALTMSLLNAIFLDKDHESHEFQSRNLSGVSDIIGVVQEALSGASSTPMAMLFGTEPRGFASAEEVTERYYTGVEERRQAVLTPQVERIIELILTAYVSPFERPAPNSWTIEWRPLRMPSELEKAKIRKATFDALKVENEAIAAGIGIPGALSAQEIRSTQGADRFSVDPVLDLPPSTPLPKAMPLPPASSPGPSAPSNGEPSQQDVPPVLSEQDLFAQEQVKKQEQFLEDIRAMGDELRTADELAQEFNLPVRFVLKQLKSNSNQRFMKGYGARGKTAYSKSDFLAHCIKNDTLSTGAAKSAENAKSAFQDPYENWHTARQKNPNDFKELKVIKKTKEGVHVRGGVDKTTGQVDVQSIWLPASWSREKALKWLRKNDFSTKQFEEAEDT